MRIVPVVPVPAKPLPVPPRAATASPAAIICAALMLALVFLAFQIAGALRTSSFSDCSPIGDSVKASCPSS
jgi:hypothetical protein